MKKYILIALMLISTMAYAETVSLSKDQFDNLDIVDKSLREKYAQYKGLNGSADNLEIHGISEKSFMDEVKKLKSADEIKNDRKIKESEEELIKKRMRKIAIDSLKADGVAFKQVSE